METWINTSYAEHSAWDEQESYLRHKIVMRLISWMVR
jgi:hypothetical protein